MEFTMQLGNETFDYSHLTGVFSIDAKMVIKFKSLLKNDPNFAQEILKKYNDVKNYEFRLQLFAGFLGKRIPEFESIIFKNLTCSILYATELKFKLPEDLHNRAIISAIEKRNILPYKEYFAICKNLN